MSLVCVLKEDKMKYLYFALFTLNENNQYEVTFPDLAPNAATYGDTLSEALFMAKDALTGYLLTIEDGNEVLPNATAQPQKINHKANDLVVPIEVDTTIAREREQNRSVKKTLTIPKYLNDLGVQNEINFSATLSDALKEKLGV